VVSWTAPTSNGGSPITGYTVTASPGGETCSTTGTLSCTVSGLTNGTPYTFTVTATNVVGTSPASAASSPVTPVAPVAPVAVPLAPSGVLGVAGDSEVVVSWTAPTSDGGSPITGYTVTASPGGETCATIGATTCTVSGLTNGTAFTFAVTATNAVGTSPGSASSSPVSPVAPVVDVVLNVTMIRPDGNGFVTIYPCGTRPDASSMNAPNGGGVVANEVIAKLSPTGTVCLYSSTPTNLAVDVTGYIAN
jgi:hypothetical protein